VTAYVEIRDRIECTMGTDHLHRLLSSRVADPAPLRSDAAGANRDEAVDRLGTRVAAVVLPKTRARRTARR